MIQEAYVSYEVAKLLKEKEFDKPCFYYYKDKVLMFSPFLKGRNSYQSDTCSAPTLQMTMTWLRDIHSIYYDIQLLLGDKAEKYGALQLGVYQLKNSGAYKWECWLYSDTYEKLYEKYIKYCLEHLI